MYGGVFVWFGLQSNHVGLYLRPPTISDQKEELAGYVSKSAVHLPLDRKISAPLIKKLVRASAKITRPAQST